MSQLDLAQESSFGPLRVGYSFYIFKVRGRDFHTYRHISAFGAPKLRLTSVRKQRSKLLSPKYNTSTYIKIAYVPYFYFKLK
jgi:hypothetical protein